MLSRINTSLALAFIASTALFSGCILVGSSDSGSSGRSTDSTSGVGGDDTTTTTTTTGEGGAGGGTTTTTTGVGGAGGTGAGVGGGAGCVGSDGTGEDVNSCDAMNITPAPKGPASSICEDNGGTAGSNPPPGYLYCQHGFKIFTAGSAEYLQSCLSKIGVEPANACDPQQASDCIDEMYKAACPTAYTDKLCTDTATACGADPFAADKCAYQLKTFNDAALAGYVDCFNNADPSQNCQQAHDGCYDAALTIN